MCSAVGTSIYNPRDLENHNWLYAKSTCTVPFGFFVPDPISNRQWRCATPSLSQIRHIVDECYFSGVMKHVKIHWTDPNIESVTFQCDEMHENKTRLYQYPWVNHTQCFEYFCISEHEFREPSRLVVTLYEPTEQRPQMHIEYEPLYWRYEYYPELFMYSTAANFYMISYRDNTVAFCLTDELRKAAQLTPIHYPHQTLFRLPTYMSIRSIRQLVQKPFHQPNRIISADPRAHVMQLSAYDFPVNELPGVLTPPDRFNWLGFDPPNIYLRIQADYRHLIEQHIDHWKSQHPQDLIQVIFLPVIKILCEVPTHIIEEFYTFFDQDANDPNVLSRYHQFCSTLSGYRDSFIS